MKHLLTIAILIFLCACVSSVSEKTTEAKTIALRFEYDDIDIMSLIDTIAFIPLETTNSSIIGKIGKIVYQHEKYYILDEQQQAIFIFDKKGKFLTKIAKQGKGPDEYSKIYDIQIYKDGSVGVLGFSNPVKIIKYKDGNNESITIQNVSADKFVILENGYLFYSASGDEQIKNRFYLCLTNRDGKIKHQWLPSSDYVQYVMSSYKIFDNFNDTVLFAMPLDNNIYQISQQEKISVRYTFDHGKHQMPEPVKDLYFKGDWPAFQKQSNGYVIGLSSWFETENLLFARYMNVSTGKPFRMLYFKASNTSKIINPNDILTIAMFNPYFSTKDSFVGTIDIANFRFNEYPDYKKTVYERCPELIRTIDSNYLSDDSNPVLITYRFKDK